MRGRSLFGLLGLIVAVLGLGMIVPAARSTDFALASASQETPIPTATPVPPAPTPTFTAPPAPTAITGPELSVSIFGSPDPVPSGGDLTYSLLVSNTGTTASPGTTVFISLPAGTTGSSTGPNCSLAGGGVTCVVPPLGPNDARGFTFVVNVTAGPGNALNAVAIVDPAGLIPELDKTNNSDTATNLVGAPLIGPSPTPTPEPLATATPIIVIVTPTPAPVEPTPVPTPAPPPGGQLWLRVLQATQTYGLDNSPLWIAQPGEWYVVVSQEAGWALAYWEGDSPDWSVWIQIDGRVEVSVQDRAIPGQVLWALILAPTQTYAQDDSPAWIAAPGEWYQVIQQDGNWILAFWEGDTPAAAVWIQLDSRVQLQRF